MIEVDEYIKELKELRDYAGNHKNAQYFDVILDAFSGKKVKTEKARAAIKEAKEKISSTEMFSSLLSQKKQSLYEKMKDFFSEHNKFEKFINDVEKNSKNRPHGFFTPNPVTSNLSSVAVIQQALKKK